jgi:hypothetical protein
MGHQHGQICQTLRSSQRQQFSRLAITANDARPESTDRQKFHPQSCTIRKSKQPHVIGIEGCRTSRSILVLVPHSKETNRFFLKLGKSSVDRTSMEPILRNSATAQVVHRRPQKGWKLKLACSPVGPTQSDRMSKSFRPTPCGINLHHAASKSKEGAY